MGWKMSGFTPGPWEISGLNDRYIVGAAYRNRLNHEVTPTVAIVKERIGQTESNARLISAVTEMLDVCLDIAKEYGDAGELIDAFPAIQAKARAAIAKTEGPQSYPEIGEGGE